MVGQPERGLHCAHVRFHAGDDYLFATERVEVFDRARLVGAAEVTLRQRIAGLRQRGDLGYRMPDAVGTVFGYSNRELKQPRCAHQRCALGNDPLAALDMGRELRLHVDYQKKGLLQTQAHRTP